MSDININLFEHSEYNTLLNNVSGGAVSNIYKRINPYQKGILEPIEMLDENYTDPRYTLSRYDGCKVISAKYNFYTSASQYKFPTENQSVYWDGDDSYGKTAAVDYNVVKFAFSNNINKKNLNFYDKAVVNIKYLINESGSITELSTANNNLFEVQNMYKKGDKVTLSLMDKYNPTNQSTLDGDKIVFEGGFSYSPLMYRELGEPMNFTYVEPVTTTENRLGIRAVNTSSILWKTIGDTNGEFTTIPGGNNIFTINSNNVTTPLSLSKGLSTNWPYSKIALSDYLLGDYKDYLGQYRKIGSHDTSADNPGYYTIDYFLPASTGSANGGYGTNDMTGKIQVINNSSEYYTYVQAPRSSTYTINVDIPIKVKATNPEPTGVFGIGVRQQENGPSIVKVIGILEVQKDGSPTWSYLDNTNPSNPVPYGYTTFTATNIPIASGGRSATGTTRALVDEANSFLYFPEDTVGGNVNGKYVTPFFEGRCQIIKKDIQLKTNDKIRLKFYFAEVTTFFRRSENIYFEVASGDNSKSYFEVFDKNNSDTVLLTTATIPETPAMFTVEPDNRTITFNDSASIMYKKVIFEPQDVANPKSLANLYSAVDYPFEFKQYDILRFSKFYTINSKYYYILEVIDPIIIQVGNVDTVQRPLQIVLSEEFDPNTISTDSFAFFRKSPDETCVMINFKKREGLTSNALLLPFNLDDGIRKNIGNIIAPLKDTVLSKVLVIG